MHTQRLKFSSFCYLEKLNWRTSNFTIFELLTHCSFEHTQNVTEALHIVLKFKTYIVDVPYWDVQTGTGVRGCRGV